MCKEKNRYSTARLVRCMRREVGGRRLAEVGGNSAEGVANLAEGGWKFRRREAGERREDGRQELCAKRRIDIAQGAPQRALCGACGGR